MAEDVVEEDFPDWRDSGNASQPKFGEGLTKQERSEIQSIVNEFSDVLQGKTGYTEWTEHSISTGSEVQFGWFPTGFHMLTERQ
jgi:hypothetical protein